MEDLEDGEIVEELGTVACKESSQLSGSLWRAGTVHPTVTSSSLGKKKPTRLRRDSCSDSESDREPGSNSDDDYEAGGKKWIGGEGCAPVIHSVLPDIQNGQNCPQNGQASQPKKKYGIWGTVLAEQSLSKDLSSWFGMNKKVESDRDVETYDYRNAQKDDPTDSFKPCEHPLQESEDNGHFDTTDICDIETFGTDSKVRATAGSSLHQVGVDQSDSDEVTDDNSSLTDNKHRSEASGKKRQHKDCHRPCVKSRLGVRPEDEKAINLTDTDEAVAAGEEIHRQLNEPEHMKATFVRIAQVLGPSKALDLLHKTEDVEKSGGLKILNGQRRRTPGGVYLFLLKGDSSVTKDHYREIFKEQYEDRKRFQKEAKKRRWGERVTSINKSAMQVDVQTPCDEKEFFLANEANSQDAQSAVAFTEAVCKGPNDIRPLVDADDDLRLDDPEMLNIELDL